MHQPKFWIAIVVSIVWSISINVSLTLSPQFTLNSPQVNLNITLQE